MKRYFIVTLLLISYTFPIFPVSKLENDPAFIEFKSKLNPGWQIVIKKDLLLIERKEPVLVMPVNRINMPIPKAETSNERIARMQKFGMKMKPTIIYRFQKRWTVNDMMNAEIKREEIQEKILSLPQKYKIEHLQDKALNSKGGDFYLATTKAEKRKVKEYFNEKTLLENEIPPLPDYHLTKFSLFFISRKGVSNEYAEVYPDSVMGEFINVEKLLFKYKVRQ